RSLSTSTITSWSLPRITGATQLHGVLSRRHATEASAASRPAAALNRRLSVSPAPLIASTITSRSRGDTVPTTSTAPSAYARDTDPTSSAATAAARKIVLAPKATPPYTTSTEGSTAVFEPAGLSASRGERAVDQPHQ